MLTLHINVDNLIHNARLLRSKTSAKLCAVVKANAYGHGMQIAYYLNDYVDCFAVSSGDEAISLRQYTRKPILVLCPSEDVGDRNVIYSAMSERDLIHKRISIKINSGMNRLGILPEEYAAFEQKCKNSGAHIDSIYTHFSDVDNAHNQFKRFAEIKTHFMRHACASNFLHLDTRFHLDMVRCGLALYGYGHPELRPVMSASTQVYRVINVKKGDKIGYTLQADVNMKVAVLGAGYADSIRRSKQKFFINGKVCETVGNICMDMCLVNVSGLDVQNGDKAEFLSKNICGEAVANANNTIVYEILTSFGSRCRRIYE